MTPEEQLLRIAALQRRFINFDTDIKRLWKRSSVDPQGYVGTPAAAEAPVVTTLPPCSATCYYIWNIFSWSPYGSNLCASQGCVCSEPLTPGAFDGEIRAGSCSPPPTTTTTTSIPFPGYCGLISGTFTVRVTGFAGSLSGCGADVINGTDTFACSSMILRGDGTYVDSASRIDSIAATSFFGPLECLSAGYHTGVQIEVSPGEYVRVMLHTRIRFDIPNLGTVAYEISDSPIGTSYVAMPLVYTYPSTHDITTFGTVEIKFDPT